MQKLYINMIKAYNNRFNKKFKKIHEALCRQHTSQSQVSTCNVPETRKLTESLVLGFGREYSPELLKLFPPVIFIHQLYSHQDPILLNSNVEALSRIGKLIQVNIPALTPSKAVLHYKEYRNWLIEHKKPNTRIKNFIDVVLPRLVHEEINTETLNSQFSLTSRDIKDIVNFGLLVLLDTNKYALTFPGAGLFVKMFEKGRSTVIAALKRSPEKELLISVMERRDSIVSSVKLGLKLQIYDIVGLRMADSVETSEGALIRYVGD